MITLTRISGVYHAGDTPATYYSSSYYYCYHDYDHDDDYYFGFLMLHPGLGL